MAIDAYRRLINDICLKDLVEANGYRKIGSHYVRVFDGLLASISIWRLPYSDMLRAEVHIDYLDRRPPPFVRYQPQKDAMNCVNWVYGWTSAHAWSPRKPIKGMDLGYWSFFKGNKYLTLDESTVVVRQGIRACHQRLVRISARVGTSAHLLDAIATRVQRKIPLDDSSRLFPGKPCAGWSDRVVLSWIAVLRHHWFIDTYASEYFYNSYVAQRCDPEQCKRFASFLLTSYEESQKRPDAQSVHGYVEFLHRAAKVGKAAFFEMPTVKESLVAANLWEKIV